MNKLCTCCKKKPIQIKKWGLCKYCYGKLRRKGQLDKSFPKQPKRSKVVKDRRIIKKYGAALLDDIELLKTRPYFNLVELGRKYGFTRERARQIFELVTNEKYTKYMKKKRKKIVEETESLDCAHTPQCIIATHKENSPSRKNAEVKLLFIKECETRGFDVCPPCNKDRFIVVNGFKILLRISNTLNSHKQHHYQIITKKEPDFVVCYMPAKDITDYDDKSRKLTHIDIKSSFFIIPRISFEGKIEIGIRYKLSNDKNKTALNKYYEYKDAWEQLTIKKQVREEQMKNNYGAKPYSLFSVHKHKDTSFAQQENSICIICKENPIEIKKWKLCRKCYNRSYRFNDLPLWYYDSKLGCKTALPLSIVPTSRIQASAPATQATTVGRSGTTPFKQADLNQLLSTQISKTFNVFNKHKNKPWYTHSDVYFIDCTAGDMNVNKITSPQIFLETLYKFKDLPSNLYLIEKDKKTFSLLQSNYQTTWGDTISKSICMKTILKNMDFKKYLSIFPPSKYRYGLIYFDSNGGNLEEFETLFKFLNENPTMDVILNINVGNFNRLRPVKNADGFEKYNNFYLSTILEKIDKYNVWIRDNIQIHKVKDKSKYEFVMIFGTNMKTYNIGYMPHFIDVDTQEGEDLVNKYNYTKREKEELLYENN